MKERGGIFLIEIIIILMDIIIIINIISKIEKVFLVEKVVLNIFFCRRFVRWVSGFELLWFFCMSKEIIGRCVLYFFFSYFVVKGVCDLGLVN